MWFQKFIYMLMKGIQRCHFYKGAEFFYSAAKIFGPENFEKSWQNCLCGRHE
jgi:hypothetical protein